ncbi:Endoribonuclease YbeY [Smittium culicis]|uniref:Endoribonuclease YbeY n=1 Tax=Smittium culicis TaxID=133412 RepID=A0A1R1YTX5_9FUNG|nr:Endoribonuclease YbeY [Smittium culicis]
MNRIVNSQAMYWVPKRYLKKELANIKKVTGFIEWDIGLHLVDNSQIALLNSQYRNKDRATDVLSFPFNNSYPDIIKPEVDNSANSSDRKLLPSHAIEKHIAGMKTSTNVSIQDNDTEIVKDLGDIVLSVEYAINDSKQNNENALAWTRILLVHSFCHLLGYDHEKEQDYVKVRPNRKLVLLIH